MRQSKEDRNAKQRAAYAALPDAVKAARHARSVARRRDAGYARDRDAYASMSPEQKAARLAQCRAWNAANKDKRAEHKHYTKEEFVAYQREWRAKNPDKVKEAAAKSYAKHGTKYQKAHMQRASAETRAARKASRKAWGEANRGRVAFHAANRRATLLRATPAWLTPDDHWLIGEIYDLCALRTRLTGVEHHVDHFYPLKGRTGCGLHVPLNLRVIPGVENLRKRNHVPVA